MPNIIDTIIITLPDTLEITMPAYVILDINITDVELYENYKKLAPSAIETYGGRYLTRGGCAENLEGNWQPNRVVMLEFDSVEQAKNWINSDEYREARVMRHQSAISQAIVVEGV